MDSFTTIIKPPLPYIGQVVHLGPIDQIAPRCYSTSIFCLRVAPNVTNATLIKRLQRMFAGAVQETPQLTACIAARKNSREELDLLYSEDSGACLIVKDYTSHYLKDKWPHGSFDDLAKAHFPYHMLENRLVASGIYCDDNKPEKCLVVQGSLIPGGLIITVAVHHAMGDGVTAYYTDAMMGKNFRDYEHERGTNTFPLDFADRNSVITPNLHASLTDLPDWRLVNPSEEFLNPTHYDAENLASPRCAIYFISEQRINELRDHIAKTSTKRPSASEAVSSVLWLHTVRAREIDASKYPEAKLSLTVNARTRMSKPAISPYFWGNMCEPNAVARMPTANFSSKDFLPSASARVRSAIENVDAGAVQRLAGMLTKLPKVTSMTWNVDRWPGPDMLIVCLQAIPFNSIDWGPDLCGRPEAFRVQIGDIEGKPDGRCMIFPPRKGDGRGLDVMMQYETKTLAKLDADKEFRHWFERRN